MLVRVWQFSQCDLSLDDDGVILADLLPWKPQSIFLAYWIGNPLLDQLPNLAWAADPRLSIMSGIHQEVHVLQLRYHADTMVIELDTQAKRPSDRCS